MGLARYFRRNAAGRDHADQVESYVQIEADDNIARGMPPTEALAAARRKFGNSALIREEVYEMNSLALFENLARDARHGFRMLRRNPVFSVAVLLTLAIGIGSNTAVFSVVYSVLFKPLPYPAPERLVSVAHAAPGAAGVADVSGDLRLSESMYQTYADRNQSFQSIGIWTPTLRTITGVGQPEQVRTVTATYGALEALAVQPILGRRFSPADSIAGHQPVVILNYGYWQRRFGGDRSIVGRVIDVDSRPTEVVGVMPPGFRFVTQDLDLIANFMVDRAKLSLPGFGFECVARLRDGVSIEEASNDIQRLVPVWIRSWPGPPGIDPRVYESWRIGPRIRPLKHAVVGSVGNVLWIVMGTIGIVMLIVVANVANLMLVRAHGRQQELAVRAALGASRGRIVRELLVESMLLSIFGGVLGLAAAAAGLRLLRAIGPGNLPRLNEVALDVRALVFAFAIAALSGVAFGLLPAFRYAGSRILPNLRAGGRALSESRERHRARNALVIAQVALALVLLVSAGLMIRTFQALRGVEPGFTHPEQIQLLSTNIPSSLVRDPGRVFRMQNDIVEKLRAIPGVAAVGFASDMPLDGALVDWDAIRKEGESLGAETPPMRVFRYISPGLLRSLGTRLVAGRDYTWAGLYQTRPETMISENLARELWGSPDAAIGKRIAASLPHSVFREVIGVVEDVHDTGIQKEASRIVYWPSYGNDRYSPTPRAGVIRDFTFAVRSERAGSESLLDQIRQAVWSVNASLPLASVRTMREVYDQSMARTSFTLVMLGIASAVALALGIIGIYGVIAYSVSQKRREIGIRLALGAQVGELRRMFVGQGLALAGIGGALGLGASALLMRLLKSLLFGVSALDPVTYLGVPVVMALAAGLASYLPARRAAAVDPVETLKAE